MVNIEKVFSELERLRESYQQLIFEHDNIRFHVNKRLFSVYMLKIGYLEYQVFDLDISIRRARREIQLIQIDLNQQKIPNLSEIAKKIAIELKDFYEKLAKEAEKIEAAKTFEAAPKLSGEESKSLKILYRVLVKQLHPDLHPDATPAEIVLYQKVVEAYEMGNSRLLQELALQVEIGDVKEIQDPEKEIRRLKALIQQVEKELEVLKSSFPYNMKDFLSDEEKLQIKQEELRNQIQQFEEIVAKYELKIKNMLGDTNNGFNEN